jgi:hypothetical protein
MYSRYQMLGVKRSFLIIFLSWNYTLLNRVFHPIDPVLGIFLDTDWNFLALL